MSFLGFLSLFTLLNIDYVNTSYEWVIYIFNIFGGILVGIGA